MNRRIIALSILGAIVFSSCEESVPEQVGTGQADSVLVRTLPSTPLDIALQFSNLLGMNDPGCFNYLEPSLKDSLQVLDLSPWEIFGRWRGFDSGGRLTAVAPGDDGYNRTNYYCSIARYEEMPPVVRIDFVLLEGQWLIEHIESQLPSDVADSISIEYQVSLVLSNPVIKREMRIARMLLDDCALDHDLHWASWYAAQASGTAFDEYIMELSQESYSSLALSNVRISGKLQLVQDRATFQVTDVPIELRDLVAAWRELAYLRKAVLRANHEAMQNLRQTGTWMGPDVQEEEARIAFLEDVFYSVDQLVEDRDTLSSVYPVLLTCGNSEPLENLQVNLDPHQLEQKVENDIGIPIWRGLGVDMNGDLDPERVLYWAGDLYLFLGTPTGYRLVWRSWMNFDSDFHSQFGTQTSSSGNRSIVLVGNSGSYEYELSLDTSGIPLFTRVSIGRDTLNVDDDLLMESPLYDGASH